MVHLALSTYLLKNSHPKISAPPGETHLLLLGIPSSAPNVFEGLFYFILFYFILFLFQPVQRAKKVVSDSPGLVDFAIGLVNSVFNLPDGQVMCFGEFE